MSAGSPSMGDLGTGAQAESWVQELREDAWAVHPAFLILKSLGHGGSLRVCIFKISFQGTGIPQAIV